MKKVVIVGGGFAGLEAAKMFKNKDVAVFLVDKSNHHTFQPLLYQVATAGLTPSDIAVPLRSIVSKQKNVEVFLSEVTHIHPEQQCIEFYDGGSLEFDYLLLATGARHSYFGKTEWERLAPGLKSVEEATEIRRRILMAFEAAERIPDRVSRIPFMTFVIVGAGPTGVEMAGAIAELARFTLNRDFRIIDPSAEVRVVLVEAGPRVLASFTETLSIHAQHSLEKLGVEIRLNTRVTEITEDHVVANEERIDTYTVLWAAGVVASPLAKDLTPKLDHVGRVQVEPDLSVPGWPHIFIAGDLASFMQPNGTPVPGVAPAALQEGKAAAKNILRLLQGQQTQPFRYLDKGNLATIGRNAAVFEFGKIKFGGFFAWLIWLVVHIFFLIGFRNRFFVAIEWAYAYFAYKRGARLITNPIKPTGSPKLQGQVMPK